MSAAGVHGVEKGSRGLLFEGSAGVWVKGADVEGGEVGGGGVKL